ncbi:hypothetical protein VA7868_02306 [Vibrio aerogenes CECT 7868]|uniref:CDP-diglyceride synthetase n=1 Tax=Vibrio aerogenes CECT 7868 TaxID=1216006 RepID=A0A1M5Z5B3_9VIBR|nr:CDP-archaeol synthase [Vibrio aerogenes]SHI19371.1 hypothetical protein VA7868_02306 [Vibrio aerogenes CECT 7868]
MWAEIILSALILMLPLIISGSFHMMVVKRNWFSAWAIPLNEHAFGRNKTWRGMLVMPLATIPGTVLICILYTWFQPWMLVDLTTTDPVLLGILLGIGYVIPELPNSWVKRRLKIPPGQQAAKNAFWFTLIDQTDSAIGCAIVYALMLDVPVIVFLWIILLGPLVHLIVNLTLYSIGLRKQPF